MDIVSSSAENFWVIQGDPLRWASEILHQLIGGKHPAISVFFSIHRVSSKVMQDFAGPSTLAMDLMHNGVDSMEVNGGEISRIGMIVQILLLSNMWVSKAIVITQQP
jgi:hypothetical protein